MKTLNLILQHSSIAVLAFLCLTPLLLPSCAEEGADQRPGLYIATNLIDAFPGKQISITGQASCYTGLKNVSISCEAWNISEVTDLSSQKPVVWNFDYTFNIPTNAIFPQQLLITATDVHGTEMKKEVTMRYVPATTPPYIEGLQPQIAINFDTVSGQGDCLLKATLYGEDFLKQAVVEIQDDNFSQTFQLNRREEEIVISHIFKKRGNYPMTITISDNSGNITISEYKLVVMLPEILDEISDYTCLWAFKSNTNKDDFIFGFYQYVKRLDAYQYQVEVYAESDDTEFLFSTTMETNGERLFGVSPLVENRFISVQSQPGYVQGFKPGKGYWGIWVDINEKVIKKWVLDISEARQNQLYYSADWNSWGFDLMSAGETKFQKVADITIYKGNQYFCFAEANDWTKVWRTWQQGNDLAGWWFSEDGSGSGATLPTINQDIDATISFDTAIKWCYIIKK